MPPAKPSDAAAIRRQLKIRTGVIVRLQKENKSYQKEEEDLARKLEKFLAADNAEAWDIKNTRNMMEESRKLVKDTSERLEGAVQDLRDLIVGTERDSILEAEDEELTKAKNVLQEVST